MSGRARLPRLHAVTDDATARLTDLDTRARAVAALGDVALHARGPSLDGRLLLELARRLRDAARGTKALLFVNDRLDVARIAGADGAQLPGGGLPLPAARALLGPDVLIGRSVHSAAEALEAHADGADYVFLGPIWETASHPGVTPLGPDAIARAAPARVIAIGGITAARAPLCRAAGAHGVAAISAIWRAADPGGAAREMLLSLE